MIKVVDGNLLNAAESIIGHQTNTKGVWGSGIAKVIKQKYPEAYPLYRLACHEYSDKLLGLCWTTKVNEKRVVANLFGQTTYGRNKNIVHTDYDALRSALESLKLRAKKFGHSVALPYNIGCGLANGDWKVVYGIIGEVFSDYEVTLNRL
ncbi:macro domain-containing protein [Paenibacillus sp. CFBP 13594]|uniref:macro domain-containing protein n=1 Tax=Paenibacillus sp. CFBP 13594 TaxID=2774037 RepID=UPI00177E9F6F|nr:macro domain-containing protein [Paenibacillus sp. CFBP 13594]MBD8839372.1 macro domain-containing protein [Paenibacillus sp. CFBP 13594]